MNMNMKAALKTSFSEANAGIGTNYIEVGVDEAGRGCLAGPVVAGAVIWDPNFQEDNLSVINDSKKLSAKKRATVSKYIKEHALAYGTHMIDNATIDDINIRQATFRAMHGAITVALTEFFKKYPERTGARIRIVVDGNDFKPYFRNNELCGVCDDEDESELMNIQYDTVIGGDRKYIHIAAASILAKTMRDNYMIKLCEDNPDFNVYKWSSNMGYGSKDHLQSIKDNGITKYHRKSYAPCKEVPLRLN